MRRKFAILCVGMALVAFGCSEEQVSEPVPVQGDAVFDSNAEALAWTMVTEAGWEVEASESELEAAGMAQCHGHHGPLFGFERTVITGDIAHYYCEVRVGPGPYEVIGIHRVVKERRPYKPIRTPDTVFMLHGHYIGFDGVFLPGTISPTAPEDFGLAVHMAENDVDVWGMDQAWCLIPEGLTNFDFMQYWGLQKEIDHLNAGLAVVRFARLLTGNGWDKMLLLGYSSGTFTGYGLLNQETQIPERFRQVKGLIPVDFEMKTDWQALIDGDRAWLEGVLIPTYEGGTYQEDVLFRPMAEFARSDPNGPSPIFAGLTNREAVLVFAAWPWTEECSGHYLAGVWEDNFPVDLRYTPYDRFLDFMDHGAFVLPMLFTIEMMSLEVDHGDLPFDDHLAEITVPIFAIGSGGGFMIDPYMDELVGSTDFTELIVRLEPPGNAVEDIAHIDVFTADDAPELFWQPILEWVLTH